MLIDNYTACNSPKAKDVRSDNHIFLQKVILFEFVVYLGAVALANAMRFAFVVFKGVSCLRAFLMHLRMKKNDVWKFLSVFAREVLVTYNDINVAQGCKEEGGVFSDLRAVA